jgi:hypothetical protein
VATQKAISWCLVLTSKSMNALDAFTAVVQEQIDQFPTCRLIRRLVEDKINLTHYHSLLATLFHQTYSSPYTFARAAANCSWRHEVAKDYLLKHAEEERVHWRWVLNDLSRTGYDGPDLRTAPPHPTCFAYVALNYYLADEVPVARLAAASVLEGIGASFGGKYGRLLIATLELNPSQASFLLSHGETDKTHIVELRDIIAACELTEGEWTWMERAACTAGTLYRAMYDHEAFA